MSNPYEKICRVKGCNRPVEVQEGEDGPWTSGMCPSHNDRDAERYREFSEWQYYHSGEKS